MLLPIPFHISHLRAIPPAGQVFSGIDPLLSVTVLDEQAEIIGAGGVICYHDAEYGYDVGYVWTKLSPAIIQRPKSLYRTMLGFLEALKLEQPCDELRAQVHVSNPIAQGFVKRLGFKQTRTVADAVEYSLWLRPLS